MRVCKSPGRSRVAESLRIPMVMIDSSAVQGRRDHETSVRHPCACTVDLGRRRCSSRAAQAPKPGPEHARLGYFVGKWNGEGEMKPGPMGPGGKMKSTDTCEWFEGRFSVICRYEGTTPMGPTKSLGILGYSTEEKVYTYYGVDNTNMTMASVPKGTRAGRHLDLHRRKHDGGPEGQIAGHAQGALSHPVHLQDGIPGTGWEVDAGDGEQEHESAVRRGAGKRGSRRQKQNGRPDDPGRRFLSCPASLLPRFPASPPTPRRPATRPR